MMTKVMKVLADIQSKLNAPKNKNNDFGGYKYRNAEGIIAAYKGLGIEGATLTMSDAVAVVGDQIFLTATATLTVDGESVSTSGCAMHSITKKGMDAAQISGSASSYARKYALSGLFAIDDSTDDPDSRDNRQRPEEPEQTPAQIRDYLRSGLNKQSTPGALEVVWGNVNFVTKFDALPEPMQNEVKAVYTDKRKTLGGQQ